MKLLVLYRPNSEFARAVENFVRDLQTHHNVSENQLEVLDYDSREGAATASLYEATDQPSMIVVNDDGSYVKHWAGSDLPLIDEVAGYLLSYS
ncbi:MAG TPA: hypothetical protein VLE99_05520 [Candidatus Saccharimonadales bacterium]|nr:hypothetical protein [Candidatus Saccharimonadales bacterium]